MATDEIDDNGLIVDVPDGEPHGGRKAQSPESLERDAHALRLKSMGYSLSQINQHLGYASDPMATGNVARALKRARARILEGPVLQHVATELARFDFVQQHLAQIIASTHVTVSGGKLVYDENGNPLEDVGPKLAALAQTVRVSESLRKMLGVDAAIKLDVDMGPSEVDKSIQELVTRLETDAVQPPRSRGTVVPHTNDEGIEA